ncbi:hypothetical protein HB4184_09295 [Pseudomonas putida]|nr:hypothetical protein HB4184_09295 [Pseudomonas putida]
MRIYIYNKLSFSEKLLIILTFLSLTLTIVLSYLKRPAIVENCIYTTKFISFKPYYGIKDECITHFDQLVNTSNYIYHYGLWFGILFCCILLAITITKTITWLFEKK